MFMKVKGNIQFIFSLNLNRVFQYSRNWFFCWQLFATWLKKIIKKLVWLIQRIFVKTKCAKVVPNLKGDLILFSKYIQYVSNPSPNIVGFLKFVYSPF